MKFGNDLLHRIERGIIYIFSLIFVFALIDGAIEGNWLGVIVAMVLLYVFIYCKYETATGELTEEGVYVRHFFIRHFYRWEEIRQAGVLYRQGRNSYYEIILVKPCGFDRKPGSDRFLFRNQFRLIHIPYGEPLRHYVISCYGQLDFDQRGL